MQHSGLSRYRVFFSHSQHRLMQRSRLIGQSGKPNFALHRDKENIYATNCL